jgi:hypothetical protein
LHVSAIYLLFLTTQESEDLISIYLHGIHHFYQYFSAQSVIVEQALVLFAVPFHPYSTPVLVLNISSSRRGLVKASRATIGTWDGEGGTRLS